MFNLDDEEKVRLEKWLSERPAVTPENAGASGGAFTYSFTPTTLGTVAKVRDNRTGEECDLTDYDLW